MYLLDTQLYLIDTPVYPNRYSVIFDAREREILKSGTQKSPTANTVRLLLCCDLLRLRPCLLPPVANEANQKLRLPTKLPSLDFCLRFIVYTHVSDA